MSNIIDELVVLVKIDGKQSKKGLNETVADVEAAKKRINVSAEDQQRIDNSRAQRIREREQRQEKERKQRDRDRAKSTRELGDTVKDVAFSLGGALLGFETIKGAIGFLGGLVTQTAQLGRASANLGQSAQGLQAWGNAVQLAGGDSKDAQASFAALSQQLTAFKLTGAVGPLLALAQNNGVYTRDEHGNTKPLDQLLPQIVDAVRARYSRADAFNLLSGAGVSEGLFNLLADPNRATYLAQGKATAFADDEKVRKAQEAAARRAELGQKVGQVGADTLDRASNFAAYALDHPIAAAGKAIAFPFTGTAETVRDLYQAVFGERGATIGVRNNNPGNLMDRQGNLRQFTTMAGGETALSSDIDAKIDKDGLNSIRQIISKYAPAAAGNDTKAYIDDVAKRLGIDPDDPITSREQRMKLVEAIVRHEQGKTGAAQVSRAIATPTAIGGDTNNTGGDTTLHVGKIEVNGVDPNNTRSVAGGIFSAMDSKLASQSNQGITP
jgi:hypothetical protein